MKLNDFKKFTIGEIADIKHGYAFKGNYFSDKKTPLSLVTPANFEIGGGFKKKMKYYNGPVPEGYILDKGDLIVTMTDLSKMGDTLGFSALVPESNKYLHNQRIGLVKMKSQGVIKDFLYWLMRTPNYQRYIVSRASGSTVWHTAPKIIASYEFLAPNIKIQHHIATTLSVLDAKIENNKKINHHLLEQAISIHKEYCISKVDSSFTTETIKSLSKDVITGKTPSTKIKEYYGGELPFITIPDMHGKVYCVETARYLTPLGEKSQSNKTLPANSIAVSCIATPGLVSFLDRASQTNQQINTVIPQENQEYYMYLELMSKSQLINELGSSGSTTHNLNKGQFEKITIIAPPVESRIKLNNLLKPLFENIRLNQRQIIGLQQIRNALLPKLMSGEISVTD